MPVFRFEVMLSMDVKTHALDRLLEALSPAVSAELDRVAQETRGELEQEFQRKLDSAVRDAEAATSSAVRAEMQRTLEQTVDQAKEQTRREVSEEMERQFEQKLGDETTRLQNDAGEARAKLESAMKQMKEEWSSELTKLEDERDRWRTFAQTQRAFAESSSQPEMLTRFLDAAHPFANGLAVYVSKADGLALWKSKGSGVFPKIVSRETTDPESYFRTLSVRGKTVGAVVAAPTYQSDALDFLSASLEHAIEAFGLKLHAPASKSAV
jgi:hypothetical protein